MKMQATRSRVSTDRMVAVDPITELRLATCAVVNSAAKVRYEAAKLGADVSRWRRESGAQLVAVRALPVG